MNTNQQQLAPVLVIHEGGRISTEMMPEQTESEFMENARLFPISSPEDIAAYLAMREAEEQQWCREQYLEMCAKAKGKPAAIRLAEHVGRTKLHQDCSCKQAAKRAKKWASQDAEENANLQEIVE